MSIETKINIESIDLNQLNQRLNIDEKANKTGYYQEMSVGVADNLVGRDEAIEREFIFDQSGGAYNNILEEDTARIESIQGNSIVYNNLIKNTISTSLNTMQGWVDRNGQSIVEGDTIICTTVSASNSNQIYQKIPLRANDKIFISYGWNVGWTDGYNRPIKVCYSVGTAQKNLIWDEPRGNSGYTRGITTVPQEVIDLGADCVSVTPYDTSNHVGEQWRLIGFRIVNLTKMFGAGYEPTIAEEAERIINQLNVPDGHNAGQLINNNTTAIKTVGLNAWDGVAEAGFISYTDGENQNSSTYMRSANYIPIIPTAKYYPNIFQQYGHLGAFVFRIYFYDRDRKFISYITKYANWGSAQNVFESPQNASYIRFVFQLPIESYKNDICIHLLHTGLMKGMYRPYEYSIKELPTIEGGLRSVGDVCDELIYNHNTDKWEYIKRIEERVYKAGDENNADVLTDGKDTTYYKLNEAVIEELDTDISPDYKVWDWGTEEAIQVTPSAPFKASIKYGFNAVDQIRGNKLRIEELSKTSVTEEELQLSINAITNAYPSGDPMHEAYVAAGAVWDDATKTWRANGRSGLSNSDVRSLYNKSDMDELLFRKLWNKACLYSGDNNNYMGRYNPNTGFYELNGVWDLTYEEALASYALSTETNYTSFNVGIMIESARLRTTIPSKGYGLFFGITQNYTVADLSTTYYSSDYHNKVAEGFGNNLQISYAMGLRVIRDVINCINSSTKYSYPTIKETPVKHIKLNSIYTNIVYMYNNCPYLSYFTFEYAIKNVAKKGITLYVDDDTYAYILGTKDPTLLSKDAVLLSDRTGYLIPYDKNSKVMHRNTFWREELDVKGVNGEYIYPSFNEYLANNPENFATAEDWQALATLAEEKGVTITTA